MNRDSPNQALVGHAGVREMLNTPALGVDLDVMEANLRAMSRLAAAHGVALRPHAKAHKSARIARLQIAAGAVGICCATIGEAEVMADAGIEDILVTAPLASRPKLARLASLLGKVSRLAVVADDPDWVDALAKAAGGTSHRLTVLVDIDVGQRRTGVTGPAAAAALAGRISGAKSLIFGGIQGYAGNLQSVVAYPERLARCREVHQTLRAVRSAIESAGVRCPGVTGVGTGTVLADLGGDVFTEIQPGSYLFMDAQYSGVEIDPSTPQPFRTALRFFTRIISAPHAGFATTDGGSKSMPGDGPAPRTVAGVPDGTAYGYSGDEFGRLAFADPTYRAAIGALVECHVPHCDTAMAAHDHLLGFRGDRLELVWPIDARGAW